ncbi:hypothetical protein LQW54_000930 [Pestalotiopsis sp. IQ-011]
MRSVPQPPRKLGRDALGAGNFSGGQGGAEGGVTGGAERMVADSLQPSSGRPIPHSSASLPVHSSSTPNTHAIQAFYRTATDPSASSSMHDLSRPGPGPGSGPGRGPPGGGIIPQLKTSRSTPNVGMRRMDSFPNLMSNLDAGAGAPRPQPAPSGPNGRQKPRVDPLDVHFARGPAGMPLTHSPMPLTANSPLSRSPLARDQPPAMVGGNDLQPVPKALNIVKAPPSPAIPPRSALRKPPSKPPSPAPSAMASSTASLESDGIPVRDLERPFMPAASDSRPSSRGSNRGNIPSTLRELMAVDEFLCDSPTDAVPTPPPSLPRASNDSVTRPSLNEPPEAVVQTVRAKRDTVTISPAKKRSLEKKIEAFDSSLRSEGVPRSASEHRAERPAPLKVKTVLNHTAMLQGPSSAPVVAPGQRSESPYGRTPAPLGRARTGVPAAAVGAQGRPRGPTMQRVRRPTINEYGVTPSRSGTPVMDEAGGAPVRPVIHIEIPERGPSPPRLRSPPDSPILPTQGPLSARSPPDSPILPSHGPLSAVSPSGSPIFPSFGQLSEAGSPPSSPILPSRGPLSAGSSPPGSPILPSHGPLSAGSPPDSPIIPSEGPLSNPASPPDSPIMPLSGPLAYSGPAAKKDDPRRETLDRGFQFPARPKFPEKPEPQPEPAPESLVLPPPMSQMAPPGGLEWPLFAPSIPMPESRAGSPALMMRTQSPVLPIARSQSPAAMPARAQSPAFSVRAQSPALPAVRAQSPALPVQRTQSPAMPIQRTQSPALPISRTQSPALPAQRTQSPFAVQPPQSPAVNVQRTQSPFAVQAPQSMQPPQSPFAVPSFSRPRPSTPVKRSELPVPVTQQQMRGPSPSPRGPPPRANTDLYGMRNSPKPMMNSRMARDYM